MLQSGLISNADLLQDLSLLTLLGIEHDLEFTDQSVTLLLLFPADTDRSLLDGNGRGVLVLVSCKPIAPRCDTLPSCLINY